MLHYKFKRLNKTVTYDITVDPPTLMDFTYCVINDKMFEDNDIADFKEEFELCRDHADVLIETYREDCLKWLLDLINVEYPSQLERIIDEWWTQNSSDKKIF